MSNDLTELEGHLLEALLNKTRTEKPGKIIFIPRRTTPAGFYDPTDKEISLEGHGKKAFPSILAHEIAHWRLRHPQRNLHTPLLVEIAEEIAAWKEAARNIPPKEKVEFLKGAKRGLRSYIESLSKEEVKDLNKLLKLIEEEEKEG